MSSLKHYNSRPSSAQLKTCSEVLSNALNQRPVQTELSTSTRSNTLSSILPADLSTTGGFSVYSIPVLSAKSSLSLKAAHSKQSEWKWVKIKIIQSKNSIFVLKFPPSFGDKLTLATNNDYFLIICQFDSLTFYSLTFALLSNKTDFKKVNLQACKFLVMRVCSTDCSHISCALIG